MATDFDQRRNDILEVVIETYISTASPVGSALISRKMRRGLSSATIRNVMAELEEGGLLEHPHTSAGRVPTDRGYRYYVNSLMEVVRLSPEESKRLAQIVNPHELELDQLFERVSEVLAQLSHEAAFVVAPTVKHSTVKQIELLPLGLHRLLCVLVAQEAMVSHVVDVEEPISRDEALSLAHFLNTELVGLSTQELLVSLERRLLAVNDSFYHLIKRALAILQTALATEPEEHFFMEGTMYLFEQPEFLQHPQRAHELLRHLELGRELLERMRAELTALPARTEHRPRRSGETTSGARQPGMTSERVCVRIGREVEIDGLQDCSYVLAPFGIQQTVLGGVGVLGPKRMDYRRIRALVDGVADLMTDAMTQWGAD